MDNDFIGLGDKLTYLLQNNVVDFSFEKLNGEIRLVTGTLNMEIIPKELHPKLHPKENLTEDANQNINQIRFFDTNKNEWRSCRRDAIEAIHGYMNYSFFKE